MRHIMSPLDFSVEELDQLLNLANDIEANPKKYAHACDGKKLATLFYEPSTRTRLSFEAAMMNLGVMYLVFLRPIPAPLQKERPLQTPFAWSHVMPTSVQCVIQKKVHRLWHPYILQSR